MDTASVIVAIASPPGEAPRGIVRVSGAESFAKVRSCVDVTECDATIRRGILRARMRAPLPPCPCLLLAMPGPASSTGEDCAEIHLVGNPWLMERVVTALASQPGVRRALPGEFSARAVLNGRATVAEAERVAHAVAAETDAQLRAANELRTHAGGQATAAIADQVATLLALVEAGIDFTDQEDVSAIAPATLVEGLSEASMRLRALATTDAGKEAALAAPLVVLAGPPNAGKSSLFNALLGRARTVASPLAGTTRDVVREQLQLPDGRTVILADAPGLDTPQHALDLLMRDHAERALDHADIVLWCSCSTDASAPPHALRAAIIAVRTKCDLEHSAPDTVVTHTATTHRAASALCTSALSGAGIPQLLQAISTATAQLKHVASSERTSVGSVQRALMSEALAAMHDAQQLASAAAPGARQLPSPELIAASLRTALDRLGEMAGAIPPDDVLGRLFAQFCVGK